MVSGYSEIFSVAKTLIPRKKAKKFVLIAFLLLAALVTAAFCLYLTFLTIIHPTANCRNDDNSPSRTDDGFNHGSKAIRAACNNTLYPKLCISSLSSYPGALCAEPQQLVIISMKLALQNVNEAYGTALNLTQEKGDAMEAAALKDCLELLDDSKDQLNNSINRLSNLDEQTFDLGMKDVQIWVSASLTDVTTCSDGFDGQNGLIKARILEAGETVSEFLSNSLALVNTLLRLGFNASSWQGWGCSRQTPAAPSSPACC